MKRRFMITRKPSKDHPRRLPRLPRDEELVWQYQQFLRSYLRSVAEPAFYRSLRRLFPGFQWNQDDEGKWVSDELPKDSQFEPRIEHVCHPTALVEENGELMSEEEAEEDYSEPVEFHVDHVEARPFGYHVIWEPEPTYDGYEFPDLHSVELASPLLLCKRGTDPAGIRQCWRLLER